MIPSVDNDFAEPNADSNSIMERERDVYSTSLKYIGVTVSSESTIISKKAVI